MCPSSPEMTTSRQILQLAPDTPEFGELTTLFSRQPSLVLATCRDGQPYCSLMAHAERQGLQTILMLSPDGTRKVENIRANPAVSLLISNHLGREGLPEATPMAATVTGTAEIMSPDHVDDLESLFLARHPHLRQFCRAPSTVAIQVTVTGIMLVRHFQEVIEFAP